MRQPRLSAPKLLNDTHDLAGFTSGEPTLDDWLRKRARPNLASGASRTFVVANVARVVGYYALAFGSVAASLATGKLRRNMPDPIPVVVLGRLAVDQSCKGKGIGRGTVRDAGRRVLTAGEAIGIRALLVHAISDEAKAFYLALGFAESPLEPMTLMLGIEELKHSL